MNPKYNQAFTLIELMVGIFIVAVLSGFVVSTITNSGAKTKVDLNSVKVLAMTVKNKLAQNIIGDWSFYEGSGAVLHDSSDYNNSGTITGGTWLTGADCINDNCLGFNGTSDWIDLKSSLSYKPNWTFSAWIYPENGNTIYSEGIPQTTFKINRATGGVVTLMVWNYDYAGNWKSTSSTGTINLNAWNFITISMSGAGMGTGTVNFYVNGTTNTTTGGQIEAYGSNAMPYASFGENIGAQHSGGQGHSWFQGRMDDIVIFDASYSFAQIQKRYLAGLDKLLAKGEITQEDYDQKTAELQKQLVKR